MIEWDRIEEDAKNQSVCIMARPSSTLLQASWSVCSSSITGGVCPGDLLVSTALDNTKANVSFSSHRGGQVRDIL